MEIIEALKKGPLLGKELYVLTGIETLDLWRACNTTRGVITKKIGKKYLRFDKKVDGYARLSPAIQREFLTYTVVGLVKDRKKVEEKVEKLRREIKEISDRKFALALKLSTDVMNKFSDTAGVRENVCFIIGGDVPLGMAHSDPRPERSTGEMVAGSDLDIVALVSDNLQEEPVNKIDDALYERKNALLRHPTREEIDYLVKRLSKAKEQIKFDSFDKMVACKIMHESKFLCGSRKIYNTMLALLKDGKIPEKLKKLEKGAMVRRKEAEKYLLNREVITEDEYMKLFTTTEEFSEIF